LSIPLRTPILPNLLIFNPEIKSKSWHNHVIEPAILDRAIRKLKSAAYSRAFCVLRRLRGALRNPEPSQTLRLWDRTLGISEDTTQYELLHANKLDNKERGDLAEMVFLRKASNMGFGVAKPWADSERYDFVVRAGRLFWRV
jgi:hypothetical protein